MIRFGDRILPILQTKQASIILHLQYPALLIFRRLCLIQLFSVEISQLDTDLWQARAVIDVHQVKPFRHFDIGGRESIRVDPNADDLDRRGRRLHRNGNDHCHDWLGGSSALRSPSQACEGDEECETECNQSPQSETTK